MSNIHESLEELDDFSNNIVSMQEELSHHLEQASILSRKLLEAKETLNQHQSRVDSYSNDNLHMLELMSLDAVELVKVAVLQKKILNSRRLLKNGFEILYKNYKKYHSFLSLNLIEGVPDRTRHYHFRRSEMYDFATSLKSFSKTEDVLMYNEQVNAITDKKKKKRLIVNNTQIKPAVPTTPSPPVRILDTIDQEIAIALQASTKSFIPKDGNKMDFNVTRGSSDTINYKSPYSSRRITVSTRHMHFANALKEKHSFRYVVMKPKNVWVLRDTDTGQDVFDSGALSNMFAYLCEHDVTDVFFHDSQFHGIMQHIYQMMTGTFEPQVGLATFENYLERVLSFKRL